MKGKKIKNNNIKITKQAAYCMSSNLTDKTGVFQKI